jgi:hypothetical protein
MKNVYRALRFLIGCVFLGVLAGLLFVKLSGEHLFRTRVLASLPFSVEVGELRYIFPATFEARDVLAERRLVVRRVRFLMGRDDLARLLFGWLNPQRPMVISGRLLINGADIAGLKERPVANIDVAGRHQVDFNVGVELFMDASGKKVSRLRYEGNLDFFDER